MYDQYDDQELQSIIWNAKIPNGSNRVSRDLTEKQANQILYRSRQLSNNDNNNNDKNKNRQIEECWRLWEKCKA